MSDQQDGREEPPQKRRRGGWDDAPPGLAAQADVPDWLKDLANNELASNKGVPATAPPGQAHAPMPARPGVPVIMGAIGAPPIDIGGGIQITIAGNQVGTIIGKGGEVINRIRQESGADVKVQHQEGEQSATVTIKGSPTGIDHAHNLVKEKLAQGGLGSTKGPNGESWVTRIHECAKDLCGLVIGSGGCNLKTMEESSGCRVNFVKATELDPNAEVGKQVCRIRGPPEKIHGAEQLLFAKMEEVAQYRDRKFGGKGAAKGWQGGGGDQYAMEPKSFVKLRGMPFSVSRCSLLSLRPLPHRRRG